MFEDPNSTKLCAGADVEMRVNRDEIAVGLSFMAVAGVFALAAIPNFVCPPRCQYSALHTCINNLRQLDGAKEQYLLDHEIRFNDMAIEQLCGPGRYLNRIPVCPAGGVYELGSVGEVPTCSVAGHAIPQSRRSPASN